MYNKNGLVESVTDANGNTYKYEYDLDGNCTKMILPDNQYMETKYDIRGRIIEEIDQTGSSTKYAYDNADHLISVTDSNGSTWTYDYDVQGNITCVTDPQGNKTSYTFDKMNRLVKITLPMGMTATNTYDKYGYKTAYTDYNGDTTRYVYDEYYDLDKVIYADGTTTDYTYDKDRMLVQVDFNGQIIKYEYNELDGLKKKSLSDGTYVLYNYYDDRSLKSVTTNFSTTAYEYDILGRLTKVTDHNKGITVYEYDKVGNLVKSTNPIGTTTEYIYDSVNRLLDETVISAKGEVLRKYSYTLDEAGRRTKVVESGKDISERTVQYTFDSLGRLEKETVRENGKTSTVSYTFDNLSNRISKNDNGTVTKYTYDANNRLLTEGAKTYTYDKNGNTISISENGVTTTYTYFVFGRLKSVSDGTTTESYDYNYQGGRISKTTNGNTTSYLLDDSGQVYNVLAEYGDALNATSIYTYGTDMISIDNSGTVSYYLTDGQGSTRALTDENGIITDTYTYDAFGNITAQTGDTYNPYLYNQEQYDVNTGLYYLRARYMNPSTGRFISMDAYSGSIYDPMSLHKYLYANSSPTIYCDPTGYNDYTLGGQMTVYAIIGLFACIVALNAPKFGSTIASILYDVSICIGDGFNDSYSKIKDILYSKPYNADENIKDEVEDEASVDVANGEKVDEARSNGTPREKHKVKQQGKDIPKNGSLGTEGEPNSSEDLLDENGELKQRRYYGPDGRVQEDIDFKHGGNGNHEFPHRHSWDWNQNPPRLGGK